MLVSDSPSRLIQFTRSGFCLVSNSSISRLTYPTKSFSLYWINSKIMFEAETTSCDCFFTSQCFGHHLVLEIGKANTILIKQRLDGPVQVAFQVKCIGWIPRPH